MGEMLLFESLFRVRPSALSVMSKRFRVLPPRHVLSSTSPTQGKACFCLVRYLIKSAVILMSSRANGYFNRPPGAPWKIRLSRRWPFMYGTNLGLSSARR